MSEKKKKIYSNTLGDTVLLTVIHSHYFQWCNNTLIVSSKRQLISPPHSTSNIIAGHFQVQSLCLPCTLVGHGTQQTAIITDRWRWQNSALVCRVVLKTMEQNVGNTALRTCHSRCASALYWLRQNHIVVILNMALLLHCIWYNNHTW